MKRFDSNSSTGTSQANFRPRSSSSPSPNVLATWTEVQQARAVAQAYGDSMR